MTAGREKRTLLVANPGGHLQQLHLLKSRLPFEGRRLWVTADTPQSRSLLADEDVRFVPDVAPRAVAAALRNVGPARRLMREFDVTAAISTGAGMALPYLSVAAAHHLPTHFIESATRTHGPSLTGKLLSHVPGVTMHTQHQRWADDRWHYSGSVFEGFSVTTATSSPPIRSAVVSLGTQRDFGFRRLIDKLVGLFPRDVDVLWQTGATDVAGLGIKGQVQLPSAELQQAIRQADVVIAHAGTGIALTTFLAGQSPVLVPREHRHGEHVDNHQTLTADLLDKSGLAVVRRVEELDWSAMQIATQRRIDWAGPRTPLRLTGAKARPDDIIDLRDAKQIVGV